MIVHSIVLGIACRAKDARFLTYGLSIVLITSATSHNLATFDILHGNRNDAANNVVPVGSDCILEPNVVIVSDILLYGFWE